MHVDHKSYLQAPRPQAPLMACWSPILKVMCQVPWHSRAFRDQQLGCPEVRGRGQTGAAKVGCFGT